MKSSTKPGLKPGLDAGGPKAVSAHGCGSFLAEIEMGGIEAGLRFLNARTAYRYTGVYRLEGAMMRNIYLYDRLGESVSKFEKVPLGDSFCQFVMAEGGFCTSDSSRDERLLEHTYRGVLNAYFGLPLSRKPGTLYGTLCHFDFKPVVIDDREIEFLQSVTPWLMDYLE
jgi:GAF domain-containing protein